MFQHSQHKPNKISTSKTRQTTKAHCWLHQLQLRWLALQIFKGTCPHLPKIFQQLVVRIAASSNSSPLRHETIHTRDFKTMVINNMLDNFQSMIHIIYKTISKEGLSASTVGFLTAVIKVEWLSTKIFKTRVALSIWLDNGLEAVLRLSFQLQSSNRQRVNFKRQLTG